MYLLTRILLPFSNLAYHGALSGPHKGSLSGRHSRQRDLCPSGVFLLFEMGLRSSFKASPWNRLEDSLCLSCFQSLLSDDIQALSTPSIPSRVAQRRPRDLTMEPSPRLRHMMDTTHNVLSTMPMPRHGQLLFKLSGVTEETGEEKQQEAGNHETWPALFRWSWLPTQVL